MGHENNEGEIDLRELLYLLKSRVIIILLVVVLCGIGGFMGSRFLLTPKYSSMAKIYVLSKSDLSVSLADLQLGTSLTTDYIELIESRPVLEQVIKNLGLNMGYQSLLSNMSIVNPIDTRILNITVTYTDAKVAKSIVDELVNVSKKEIASIMKVDEPTIISPAYLEEQKVSPSNTKNAAIAAILGFSVTAGVIIFRHIMDDKVKVSEDITRYLRLHTLAMIPDDMEGKRAKKKRILGKHKQHRRGRINDECGT